MTTAWNEALDNFEQALLQFERDLDDKPASVVAFTFTFPADLGPLPSELLVMATSLAAMSQQTEERIRRRQSDLLREQAAVTRARAHAVTPRPRAHFVDVQG